MPRRVASESAANVASSSRPEYLTMWFSIRSDESFVKKNRSGNADRLEWGKTWPENRSQKPGVRSQNEEHLLCTLFLSAPLCQMPLATRHTFAASVARGGTLNGRASAQNHRALTWH
jgi:hypothetical protein